MSNQYLNNKSFEAIIESFQSWKKQKDRYELIIKDLDETLERLKKHEDEKTLVYVELHRAKYLEVCSNFKYFQEQLALAFYLLSENITKYYRPYGIDADDAIQEGVLLCFEKIDRFDPSKGKAFTYMTTCILNHYRQIWRSVRNYNELKRRYHGHLQEKFEKAFSSARPGSVFLPAE